jgi:tetratricopeptide (TPR) repeat protein
MSVYDLARKNDYFKRLPERSVFSFARASDFFVGSGKLEEGKTLLNYAISGWENTNDHMNLSIALNKLGLIDLKTKQWQTALKHFKESESMIAQTKEGTNELKAKVLLNEADACEMGGDKETANDYRKEAKQLWFAPIQSKNI